MSEDRWPKTGWDQIYAGPRAKERPRKRGKQFILHQYRHQEICYKKKKRRKKGAGCVTHGENKK
jgi:hypothetical protein